MEQRETEKTNSRYSKRITSRRTATFIAILYTLGVLAVALFAGSQLYDWARLRILDSSVLARLTDIEALAPLSLPRVETSEAADFGGATDSAAEREAAVVDLSAGGMSVPAINVLLMGTDARPDDVEPPRTDTMILLTVDPATQTAGMLSLPRDLWVPIPGFGFSTKINTAYMLGESRGYAGGGAQLAKDTVSSFIGQPVQYYMLVNFHGFVELVDLIGGVEVIVPHAINDQAYPTDDYGVESFYLEAGAQHLDGETALKYVRTRNMDDDYSRAGRQQEVLRAIAYKVMRGDMIASLLPKLPRLLYTMRSSIDTDIPMALQLQLANYVKSESFSVRQQLVLDNRFGEETYSEEGAWILLPDRARVRNELAAFFEPASSNSSSDSIAMSNPSWVRIEVLNGTGEPGVAAQTRELLQSQGWQVVLIGDADRDDYGRTIIVNYGVPDEYVAQVGSDLDLEPNLSSLHGLDATVPIDMRIVVGRDFLTHLK